MLTKKLICFIVLCFLSISVTAQTKKVSVTGVKGGTEDLYSEDKLGAVNFIADDADKEKSRLYIIGDEKGKPKISGYNHNLNGQKLDGYVSPIVTNAKVIKIKKLKIEPEDKKEHYDYLDIVGMVEYLKEFADVTITKDTECSEEDCSGGLKEFISGEENPKIVVVDKARLSLIDNFKGYGILILTGERESVPLVFSDEVKKCKHTGEKLRDIFEVVKEKFEHNDSERVRGGLRLTMDDNAAWFGLVISDVGVNKGKHSPLIVLGRHPEKDKDKEQKEDKDNDDGEHKDGDDKKDDDKERSQTKKSLSLLDEFILGKVYAKDKKDKSDDSDKEDGDKDEEIKERVKIYGAVLLGGSQHGAIKMAFADILYSREALELLKEKKFKNLPFEWEEYKEKE